MGSKRKKTPVILESSDSETDIEENVSQVRSSERIREKRSKAFHIPSRDEVWKKITPTKSPGKYSDLKPRKLVNNFTKENHRYNYDPMETSGEESMEAFIDDSESESTSSEEKPEEIHQSRVKGIRKRLIPQSDSEESTRDNLPESAVDKDPGTSVCSKNCHPSTLLADSEEKRCHTKSISSDTEEHETLDKSKHEKKTDMTEKRPGSFSDDTDSREADNNENGKENKRDDGTDSEEEIITPRRKRNKSSVIESEDEGSNTDNEIVDRNIKKEVVSDEDNDSLNEISLNKDTESGLDKVIEGKAVGHCSATVVVKKEPEDHESVNDDITMKTEPEDLASQDIKTEAEDDEEESSSESDSNNSAEDDDNWESGYEDNESGFDNEDSENETDSDDTDNQTGKRRVRKQMVKKKREQEKLFEKFRQERQRKLQKLPKSEK